VSTPEGLEAVSFTAAVTTRGLAGEQLIYRVRLLDSQYRPIRSVNKLFRDREGHVAATKALMVFESPWAFEDVTISIPARELEVADVEGPITAEFSLLAVDGRVLAVRGVPTQLGKPRAIDRGERLASAEPESPPAPERSASAQENPEPPPPAAADTPDLFSLMYDAFQRTPPPPNAQQAVDHASEERAAEARDTQPAAPDATPRPRAADSPQRPPGSDIHPPQNEGGVNVYEVRSGDTLTSIAKRLYGDTARWIDIFQLNRDRLDSPDLIHAGMILRIPDE
jgi:nucleoid-associated protein YgaU